MATMGGRWNSTPSICFHGTKVTTFSVIMKRAELRTQAGDEPFHDERPHGQGDECCARVAADRGDAGGEHGDEAR